MMRCMTPPPHRWASAVPGYARYPSVRTAHVAMPARPSARMAVLSVSQGVGVAGHSDDPGHVFGRAASTETLHPTSRSLILIPHQLEVGGFASRLKADRMLTHSHSWPLRSAT